MTALSALIASPTRPVPGVSHHARDRLLEHYGIALVPAAWALVLLEIREGRALMLRTDAPRRGDGPNLGRVYAVQARYGDDLVPILVVYRNETIVTVLPRHATQTIRRQGVKGRKRHKVS